mgnify:CR=1 FL=1
MASRDGGRNLHASLAERRVFSALEQSSSATSAATTCAESWRGGPTVHGDLKASHVLLAGGSVKVLDWEFAGPGAIGWDSAMLLSSLLVQAALAGGPWSVDRMSLAAALVEEAPVQRKLLARMLALCLWQAALEWSPGFSLMRGVPGLIQLGLNLVESEAAFDALLADLTAS